MKLTWANLFAVLAIPGAAFALTGDRQCQRDTCIEAVVNANSTVQYTITVNQPAQQLGWAAIGFGRAMVNTPLVVMWQDSLGKVVISHRQTSSYTQPRVVSSPPRVAKALDFKTAATSSSTSFSFEIPANTDTRQSLVYAYSLTKPVGTGPEANIVEHDDTGSIRLDLTKTTTGSNDGYGGGGNQVGADSGDQASIEPLTSRQRMIVAHGVILTIAFLVILPSGALVARLGRTYIGRAWFVSHWIFQWPLAGAMILLGFILGVAAVSQADKPHFTTPHKKAGLLIVVLYIVQCSLGGIIHFIKSKKSRRRPPQNYAHAVLGLTIIGLSFWQVKTGFADEWLRMGRGPVEPVVNTIWTAWVIIIPVLYFGGLALLPRQWKQERDAREQQNLIYSPSRRAEMGYPR